jgi:DNA-binding transcriptional MerR regulator
MSTPASFTIGELAREFGVTIRTIRFYEDQGLITPERRGTTRIYTPADRVKLILILRGKRLGFTLAESREMIDLYDPESGNTHQLERMLAKLAEKRAVLDRQLEDIRLLQAEFDVAEQRVRNALEQARSVSAKPRKKKS